MLVYAKKQEAEPQRRGFGIRDAPLMKRAKELLLGESAVALDFSREKIPNDIARRVESLRKEEDGHESYV